MQNKEELSARLVGNLTDHAVNSPYMSRTSLESLKTCSYFTLFAVCCVADNQLFRVKMHLTAIALLLL